MLLPGKSIRMIFNAFLALTVWIISNPDTDAQNSITLCAGQKGVKYKVDGNAGSTFHWSVEGGNIVSDPQKDTIIINWGINPGNYTLSVYEEKTTGCLGNIKILKVGLQPTPIFNFPKNATICEGEQIVLMADVSQDAMQNKYLWQDGSTKLSYSANQSGIYWVEVTNSLGCSFRDSAKVVVQPLPKINLGRDTMLCAPNELVLDAGNFGDFYLWSNGERSQTTIAHENDSKIWVKITDQNGCIGTDSIQILRCIESSNLLIPKAFAPRGSAANHSWTIGGVEKYPNITVKIYDRWGIIIFESARGYSTPWDGISNGREMPMDAYYYIINLGDGSKEIVGSVTLIR